MASRFKFDKVLNKFEGLKQNLPVKLANQAQNFFVDGWKKQGWESDGLQPWKPRRDMTSKSSRGRAILVKSGALRRAAGQSIRLQSFALVKLVVALPYAKVHNEGLRSGRGKGFIMPKRKFMGDSKTLRKQQRILIDTEIKKIWQA